MGTEKGLALLAGKPLIAYSIDTLSALAERIMISGNPGIYKSFGLMAISDVYPGIGPMGGIYSCLQKSETDINLVLPCDMPSIKPELFRFLLEQRGDAQVVLPSFDSVHPEPMCGIYMKELLPLMEQFIGNRNYKLPELFRTIRFRMIEIKPESGLLPEPATCNINTPEDLFAAEEYFRLSRQGYSMQP